MFFLAWYDVVCPVDDFVGQLPLLLKLLAVQLPLLPQLLLPALVLQELDQGTKLVLNHVATAIWLKHQIMLYIQRTLNTFLLKIGNKFGSFSLIFAKLKAMLRLKKIYFAFFNQTPESASKLEGNTKIFPIKMKGFFT